jgi:hypothetical protein
VTRTWTIIDWRRLMRWSILGAVVMTLWLLAPTAKCSWKAWRDEPLDAAHPMSNTPGAHKVDNVEGDGFFARWGSAIKYCYRRTPLLGQEAWKENALFGFLAAAGLLYVISEIDRRRKHTYS